MVDDTFLRPSNTHIVLEAKGVVCAISREERAHTARARINCGANACVCAALCASAHIHSLRQPLALLAGRRCSS